MPSPSASAAAVKRALAARLRQLRTEKGWSQERLSKLAGMHRTYLAGIELSKRNPSLDNLVKLADAVGVTMAELFTASHDTNAAKTGTIRGSAKRRSR